MPGGVKAERVERTADGWRWVVVSRCARCGGECRAVHRGAAARHVAESVHQARCRFFTCQACRDKARMRAVRRVLPEATGPEGEAPGFRAFCADVRRRFAAAQLVDCPPRCRWDRLVDRRTLFVSQIAKHKSGQEAVEAWKVVYIDEFEDEWGRELLVGCDGRAVEPLIADILLHHKQRHGLTLAAMMDHGNGV